MLYIKWAVNTLIFHSCPKQVKGMMIDEALVQLRYINKKAANIVSEVSKYDIYLPHFGSAINLNTIRINIVNLVLR